MVIGCFGRFFSEIKAVFEKKSKKKYFLVVENDSTGYLNTKTFQMLRTVEKNEDLS